MEYDRSNRASGDRALVRSCETVWPVVSPSDANWKAPYSARFHVGASAPGG